MGGTNTPVIKRCPDNPVLTRDDIPYSVETVHNAGIARYDGRTIMLFRSHLRNGRSIIGIAESEDGFKFTVGPEPFMIPSTQGEFGEYEAFGVEDPRISCIDGEYLITYSAYSRHGVRIGLAKTRDFRGPAPFGDQPMVCMAVMVAGPGALGRFRGSDEAGAISLGRVEDRPRRDPDPH
jgi:predicted GH43/DUF377 family glycosyl hydrolase